MKEADRIAQVRQLWLERRPNENATGNDAFAFHGWLLQNRDDLLNHKGGDSWQHLKSDLCGLFKD